MKVLLVEDVEKLGLAGDVVTVANGYGRNYLISRGLARLADTSAQKQAEQVRKTGERKRARHLAGAQDLAQRIEGLTLTFRARAGEKGKLYGSITTADLADALSEELGQPVDRRKIASEPLRQLGEHSVEVRLMANVSAHFKAITEPEGEEVEAPAEAAVEEVPQATAEDAVAETAGEATEVEE